MEDISEEMKNEEDEAIREFTAANRRLHKAVDRVREVLKVKYGEIPQSEEPEKVTISKQEYDTLTNYHDLAEQYINVEVCATCKKLKHIDFGCMYHEEESS